MAKRKNTSQLPLFSSAANSPDQLRLLLCTEWQPLAELPDLRHVDRISLDLETKDDGLAAGRGSAWPWRGGYICGVSIAYRAGDEVHAHYFPLRHPDSQNFEPDQVYQWMRDHIASGVALCYSKRRVMIGAG